MCKIALITLFTFCSGILIAQSPLNSENLYEYKAEQEVYFDSIRAARELQDMGMEGTGYRSFQSHLRAWEPLVYPEGDYLPVLEAKQAAMMARSAMLNHTIEWNWKELGPFNPPAGKHVRHLGIGRLTSLYVHPANEQTLFVTSPTGGLWYTEDEGESWQNGGTDFLPTAGVGAIVAHPFKPNYWIIATGDGDGDWSPSAGIWRTTDKGKTWEDISNGLFVPKTEWNALRITKLVTHPNNFNIIYACTNKGLFLCKNATSIKPTWVSVIDKEMINDLEFKLDNPGIIYASGSKIYESIDNGKNWGVMPGTSFTDIGYSWIKTQLVLTPADPKVIYAAVTAVQKGKGHYKAQLYRFDGRTGKWELKGRVLDRSFMPYGLIPGRDKSLAVSPKDPNVLYASNVNPMVMSTDGGASWTPLKYQVHDDTHHIIFSRGGEVMWTVNDGGVYKSIDQGQHWENKSNGIGVSNTHMVSTLNKVGARIAMGMYDAGSCVYDPSTEEWRFVSGGDGFTTMFDHENDSIMYTTATNGAVYRFDHVPESYKPRMAHRSGNGSTWNTWVVMDPQDSNTIYQAGKSVYRSTDRGNRNTWEDLIDLNDFEGYHLVWQVHIAPNDPNVIYAIVVGDAPVAIIRTTRAYSDDVKSSWEFVDHPETAWVIDMSIDHTDPLQFYIAYSKVGGGFYNKIWRYNGKRWINMAYDLPEWAYVTSIIREEGALGRVYVGTNMGVYTTGFRGRKWTLLHGLPHCEVRCLKINYAERKLVAATFGRGIWECPLFVPQRPERKK